MDFLNGAFELSSFGVFTGLIAFAFYLIRIDRRQRLLSARIGRLSITFQKIEHDIDAVQSSLLLLARNDDDMVERIASIRDRRPLVLRHIVERGPHASEILRGLEWPEFDDDPIFWKGDLAERMNLPETLAEARGEDLKE